MTTKNIVIIVGSIMAMGALALGVHIELEKAEVKGCRAVITRRLKSGNDEVTKTVDFESTINAYCAAVIKNQ